MKEGKAAYQIISDGPTIVPAATPEEGAAIEQAIVQMQEIGIEGARSHFKNAAQLITDGDFAGGVRESIHAVESVAKLLNEDASMTRPPALRALKKNIALHPALEEGFKKIYGYTSDKDGIRHALLEEGQADVDQTDAVFMLGACASFTTYLINKARSAGMELHKELAP